MRAVFSIFVTVFVLSGCAGSSTGAGVSVTASETPASEAPTEAAQDASAMEAPSDSASSEAPAAPENELNLLQPGVLQIGCEIGYPPFEYFADDGSTPIGLDVDLGDAIAEELGVTAQRVDTAWDGIFAGLAVNKYDVIISAVTINAERRETMDFSTPYIENWQSIIVKKGGEPITSIEGLDGKKVAYQDATTSDEYLDDLINTGVLKCERFEYAKVMNCFDDLNLGRVDAVLCDSTVSDGYIAREPDKFEITWLQSSDPGAEAETFGVAVNKGNEKLLNAINEAIKKLDENGKLDEIRNNWFS